MATDCSSFLPHDILEQILVKIPCTKSIVRCTSINKSWYCSLIKSSRFISTHLYCTNHMRYLVCKHNNHEYLIHHDTEPFVTYDKLEFRDKHESVQIHGCCNGVICYTTKLDDSSEGYIYLWNPCIRKVKSLHRFQKPDDNIRVAIGFWFDTETKDYQVAKVSYTCEVSAVEVYNTSTDSWKTVNDKVPGTSSCINNDLLVYIEGTLHWLAYTDHDWIIISLDIKSGTFRKTLIKWCLEKELTSFSLTVLGGHSLVVFGYGYGSNTGLVEDWHCIEIQVYNKNLDKIKTINLDEHGRDPVIPIGSRNNGEVILENLKYDSMIGLSNLETENFRDIYLESSKFSGIWPFIETLVLL